MTRTSRSRRADVNRETTFAEEFLGRMRLWGRAAHRGVGSLVVALMLFAAGCATAPSEYRDPPPLPPADRTAHNLHVFERTWALVNNKYFDANLRGVDWPAMHTKFRPEAAAAPDENTLYEILNRLCSELKESHLAAISPRRAHEYSTKSRPSVGFRWQTLDGRRVVTEIVPGSPANSVGVRPGWIVTSRNGAPLQDGDIYIPKLGQVVTYGFVGEDDEVHTLTMEPQLLSFDRSELQTLADGFVYLRFDSFSRNSLRWLSEQLKAHATSPGVIIDLRNNSGGNLLALNVALAEFFPGRVGSGRMIKRSGRENESHTIAWLSARYAGRVVILSDHATASAAEIFSHVLQYHKRATVVGRPTAGAVIASRLYPLPGGGRLQIPVTDYVGLDGRRLEGRGVSPDVAAPARGLADLREHRDPDMAVALQLLRQSRANN